LETLADSLLRDRGAPAASGEGDAVDGKVGSKDLNASRLSPKKASQLSHFLGSRKTTPVRCTPPGRFELRDC